MKRTHVRTRQLKTAVSVYSPRDAQGPTIVRGRVARVGLGVWERLVSVWEECRTIIMALLELGIWRFSLSHFLCHLFAL